jgi:hypothetical protein
MTHAGGFLNLRLCKSEQPPPVGSPTIARLDAPPLRHNHACHCDRMPGDNGDAINLYYGAADTCVGMATGSVGQLLDWLDRHGTAA